MPVASLWKKVSTPVTEVMQKAHMAHAFLSAEERESFTNRLIVSAGGLALADHFREDRVLSTALLWISVAIINEAMDVLRYNPWTSEALNAAGAALLPSPPPKTFRSELKL